MMLRSLLRHQRRMVVRGEACLAGDLEARALRRLGGLQRDGLEPGSVAILQCAAPMEFLELFWAVVLGGATVAPMPLAKSDMARDRLERLRRRLDAQVLTEASGAAGPDGVARPEAHEPLLQFSSGSTGDPTGIVLTAANLLANVEAMQARAQMNADDCSLCWMPLTHDMGLVGAHLSVLGAGGTQIIETPLWFLRNPVRWLQRASDEGATLLTTTNHALSMVLDRLPRSERTFDLSAVRRVFIGAEPIDAAVVDRTVQALGVHGLSAASIYPVYGLAEGCVALTFPDVDRGARIRGFEMPATVGLPVLPGERRLVGVGRPLDGVELQVLDDAGEPVGEDVLGRIVFDGPNRTGAMIREVREPVQGPLDTGDLGFVHEGELFVTGRRKDLAIVAATNVWLPDVERAAARVCTSRVVAVRVDGPPTEGVALFLQQPGDVTAADEATIRAAVREALELTLVAVRAVRVLPRTTSGKVRRHVLAASLELGEVAWTVPDVVAAARAHLGLEGLQADTPLLDAGVSSVALVGLAEHLSRVTGRALHTADLLSVRTLAQLVEGPADQAPLVATGDVPIAIVGLGVRTAGASGPGSLWQLLMRGEQRLGPVPPARAADVLQTRGSCDAPRGGWLDDVADFDAEGFGLDVDQATLLHPAHRLFLEVAEEALEDAGGARGRVGVFVGQNDAADGADYRQVIEARTPERVAMAAPGNLASFVGARLAFNKDWHGPVVSVDTACSASLVAVHLACQALRQGDCEVAVAGASRVMALPGWPVHMGFESTSGVARPFDVDADGMVIGEGAGVVVLKPLPAALADGDRVHAVIVASSVNHDGQGAALTVPNPRAQAEVIRHAWQRAGTEHPPAFIEAHGAGTRLSDPVELEALTRALGQGRTVPVGSLKGNVGHLFEAAGVVGLIKATLALSQRTLPPSGGLQQPIEGSVFVPTTAPVSLPQDGVVRAGVTSLGLSGTNVHVVLQGVEAATDAPRDPEPRPRQRCWPVEVAEVAEVPDVPALLARLTGKTLRPDCSFVEQGLDSIALVQLGEHLRRATGRAVPLQRLVADLDTPDALQAWLATEEGSTRGVAPTGPADGAGGSREGGVDPGPTVAALAERTATSREITVRQRAHLANNRAAAGFRPSLAAAAHPVVARNAHGAWVEDVDGHRLLDITMGFGVNLFGHSPGFVQKAVRAALDTGAPLGPMTAGAGEVARRLHQLTGVERAAFFNSGTEAVMVASRLARTRTGRPLVARFSGSYHGSNDAFLAVAGPDGSLPAAPGVPDSAVADTLVVRWNEPSALDVLWENRHDLAAVFVEPVQSRRPSVQPRRFLEELRGLCTEMGCALVFDEVITGFRMHPAGMAGLWDIHPDLRIYGKVLGGGLPIGVVAGDAAWLDGIDGGATHGVAGDAPTTFVAGTFCHHPLAMAAANAVLRHLDEAGPALQEGLDARCAALCARLDAVFARRSAPWRMARCGSLFRFECDIDGDLLFWRLLLEGVYVWEGRNCFWSTAHTDADADHLVGATERALDALGWPAEWSPAGRQAIGFFPADPDADVLEAGRTVAEARGLRLAGPDALRGDVPGFALEAGHDGSWVLHTHRRHLDGWSMGLLLRDLGRVLEGHSPSWRPQEPDRAPSPSAACHPVVYRAFDWTLASTSEATPFAALLAAVSRWLRTEARLPDIVGIPVAGQPGRDPEAMGQLSRHVQVDAELAQTTADAARALAAAMDRGTHALGHRVVLNLDHAWELPDSIRACFAVPPSHTAYDLVINAVPLGDGALRLSLKARGDRFQTDDLDAWADALRLELEDR